MQQTLNRQLHGISLRDVLPDGRALGADDIRIKSCCSDSRRCEQGDLFVALLGAECDGHDHVYDAVRRGASAVLAERHMAVSVPVFLVNDTRSAYARICHALADHPSRHMVLLDRWATPTRWTRR